MSLVLITDTWSAMKAIHFHHPSSLISPVHTDLRLWRVNAPCDPSPPAAGRFDAQLFRETLLKPWHCNIYFFLPEGIWAFADQRGVIDRGWASRWFQLWRLLLLAPSWVSQTPAAGCCLLAASSALLNERPSFPWWRTGLVCAVRGADHGSETTYLLFNGTS